MPIKHYKLVLIGLGTVARGLINILLEKGTALATDQGVEYKIVAVCTGSRGNLYNPEGLDLRLLSELSQSTKPFDQDVTSLSTETLIQQCDADIMIELSPTNLNHGQPAISYCKTALNAGKHVVCGNKGPATLAYTELAELAKTQGLAFLNEATVLSGTPALSFAKETLAGNKITRIKGILNGSTNFILHQMEEGSSYAQAFAEAQQLGYLEADPLGDIDGHDAQAKITILSNIIFNRPIQINDVNRAGIADIREEDVKAARAAGKRWKLIASLSIHEDQVLAEVKPECLPESDPLAQISGTTNALTFSTDLLGEITISGPGAGSTETGFGILADLLIISRGATP